MVSAVRVSVIWRPLGTSKSAGIGLEYIAGVQVPPPPSSPAALEVVALAQSSDILHFRLPNPAELDDIFSPNPCPSGIHIHLARGGASES
jgi:hypothetical protein